VQGASSPLQTLLVRAAILSVGSTVKCQRCLWLFLAPKPAIFHEFCETGMLEDFRLFPDQVCRPSCRSVASFGSASRLRANFRTIARRAAPRSRRGKSVVLCHQDNGEHDRQHGEHRQQNLDPALRILPAITRCSRSPPVGSGGPGNRSDQPERHQMCLNVWPSSPSPPANSDVCRRHLRGAQALHLGVHILARSLGAVSRSI